MFRENGDIICPALSDTPDLHYVTVFEGNLRVFSCPGIYIYYSRYTLTEHSTCLDAAHEGVEGDLVSATTDYRFFPAAAPLL